MASTPGLQPVLAATQLADYRAHRPGLPTEHVHIQILRQSSENFSIFKRPTRRRQESRTLETILRCVGGGGGR